MFKTKSNKKRHPVFRRGVGCGDVLCAQAALPALSFDSASACRCASASGGLPPQTQHNHHAHSI